MTALLMACITLLLPARAPLYLDARGTVSVPLPSETLERAVDIAYDPVSKRIWVLGQTEGRTTLEAFDRKGQVVRRCRVPDPLEPFSILYLRGRNITALFYDNNTRKRVESVWPEGALPTPRIRPVEDLTYYDTYLDPEVAVRLRKLMPMLEFTPIPPPGTHAVDVRSFPVLSPFLYLDRLTWTDDLSHIGFTSGVLPLVQLAVRTGQGQYRSQYVAFDIEKQLKARHPTWWKVDVYAMQLTSSSLALGLKGVQDEQTFPLVAVKRITRTDTRLVAIKEGYLARRIRSYKAGSER